jgi:molybdopterin/thiamine biosynthesis adenylyltransferase
VGEERAQASRPIRVVLAVDPTLVEQPGLQHLAWLLTTLLTRSTSEVIAMVGISILDGPLLPNIDPDRPDGGPSLVDALMATAGAFGPSSAPVVDVSELDGVDLVLQVGSTPSTAWPDADVLHVSAVGWAGAVTPHSRDLLLPAGLTSDNPFGPYVAACLAAGQAFMHARIRHHRLTAVGLDAWKLTQFTANGFNAAGGGPETRAVRLNHVLAGVGAVGSALLLTLWAYRSATGTVRAVDGDPEGVDDTNLNRCLPFHWTDLGQPKAHTAAQRLGGHHGLVIEPALGLAETLVGPATHLISAVDTPRARQALQDKYPASAIQASTSGLRLEMLRVDPTARTACLRCFNQPAGQTSDSAVRAQVADMSDVAVAAHAEAVGTDAEQVRRWGRAGGCGQIGDALLERLRPSDGGAAQFSVGFMSVLAGILLAGQVIKDSLRRDGDGGGEVLDDAPLHGPTARFLSNALDPEHAAAGVRRYARDANCPACQGVRAEIWTQRYTG